MHGGKFNAADGTARTVCLLRLSALGDVTHMLPIVHALREQAPDTRITWVIGRGEARLLGTLPGVEFIVNDKREGLAGWNALRQALAGRRFDALLLMQMSLRASLLSTAIKARMRIGFDVARSREGHRLFCNRRIAAGGHHVIDVFGRFLQPLGLRLTDIRWQLPITEAAREWAQTQLPGPQATLMISPCSSHALRNWLPQRYAEVADHAATQHGMRIALIGGRSNAEREMGNAILAAMRQPAIDLIGRDSIEQLPALLQRASLLLSPDSGPVHIANALSTPVLGLYACTDAERSGPYRSRRYCVNHYAQAAQRFFNRDPGTLRWGQRLEKPGVMALIQTAEVIERLDQWISDQGVPGSR